MRAVICTGCTEDGGGYKFTSADAVAIWPDNVDMTADRITHVAEHWEGETMTDEDVARLIGH